MFSYCAYQGCRNKNIPCSEITFFGLPKDERRQIWIANSGNPELQNLSDKTVKYFCEKHFDSKYVRKQFNRATLHKTAVPFKYNESENCYTISLPYEELKGNTTDEYEIAKDNSNRFVDPDQDITYNYPIKPPCSSKTIEIIIQNSDEEYLDDEGDDKNEISLSSTDANDTGNLILRKYGVKRLKRSYETINDNDGNNNGQDADGSIQYKSQKTEAKAENNTEPVHEDFFGSSLEEVEYIDENDHKILSQDESKESANKDSTRNIQLRENMTEYVQTNKKVSLRSSPLLSNPQIQSTKEEDATSSASNSYEEDKHYVLSLVGYFQRLPQQKKGLAKLKILQYLTELELSNGKADI